MQRDQAFGRARGGVVAAACLMLAGCGGTLLDHTGYIRDWQGIGYSVAALFAGYVMKAVAKPAPKPPPHRIRLPAGQDAAKETTTLYRAVSEAEFAQLQQTGKFQAGPNSLGGKWFVESAEDAAKWGDILNGKGASRIVETTLPKSTADQLMRLERLDGIGPARYGELDQLTGATIREVK